MTSFNIRRARLDDTEPISQLFRAPIKIWQRLDAQGRVQEPPYSQLTLYERWLHGGAWMSVETAAIYLSHLLRGAALPLIAETAGNIVGYAEAFAGDEPDPYGKHLHIAELVASPPEYPIEAALFQALIDWGKAQHYQRLTAACSSYDQEAIARYQRLGMTPLITLHHYTIPAQSGQSFYKAVEHPNPDPQQIKGWQMPIGRLHSARYHWETHWPPLWSAIDELAALRTHRLSLTAASQQAYLYCQQQLYQPRSGQIALWSPKALSPQLITAIRDWAERENYRSLIFAVPEANAKLFGGVETLNPQQQTIYTLNLQDQ